MSTKIELIKPVDFVLEYVKVGETPITKPSIIKYPISGLIESDIASILNLESEIKILLEYAFSYACEKANLKSPPIIRFPFKVGFVKLDVSCEITGKLKSNKNVVVVNRIFLIVLILSKASFLHGNVKSPDKYER